jgi:thioesterase domain-containing protein
MSIAATLPAAAISLERFIRDTIPLARQIDVHLRAWRDDALVLAAPLAPNVNDKGCAFGGSLASVMTLAGWALVELALRQRGFDCDVFVAHSELRYLAPVWADFEALATLAPEQDWDSFIATLRERGRARIQVHCRVPAVEGDAATLEARFVAKRRDS